jgi:isopenicillin-N epimerase
VTAPSPEELRRAFLLDPEIAFLNHGSFGACPRPVFERYQAWQRELESEPVDFFDRRLPGLLDSARNALADYVGGSPHDLAFVQNATTGVNLAARSLDLRPGDEVLSTDLEYGACDLAWEWVCRRAGARYIRAPIPLPLCDPSELVEALFTAATDRTRVLYVSHVTSGTGLVLPVERIVARAQELGLVTVVDGAHAPAQVPVDLAALGADYFSGNAHKWLGAPKGAGFLHDPRRDRQTPNRPRSGA